MRVEGISDAGSTSRNCDHVCQYTGVHKPLSMEKDLNSHLQQRRIFSHQNGRFHSFFPIVNVVLHAMEHNIIIKWMPEHI